MNLLYLSVLGIIIGVTLFLVDPKNKRGTLLGNSLLGITGSVIGGIYANLIFGLDFSTIGIGAILVAVFSSLLLLFIGRIIRRSGNSEEEPA